MDPRDRSEGSGTPGSGQEPQVECGGLSGGKAERESLFLLSWSPDLLFLPRGTGLSSVQCVAV